LVAGALVVTTGGTAVAQHAAMAWHGIPNTDTTPSFILTESSSVEGQISFAAPSAGKLSDLFVVCESALTGGAQSFTLRVNGSSTSLGCTVASGDTVCSDTVDSATYGVADQIAVQVVSSNAGVSNPNCNVTAAITNPDDSPHDALIAFAGHGTPSDAQYCGTTGIGLTGGSTPSNICAQPNESKSTFLIPSAGTLTNLSVKLDVAPSSGNTETYTVRNVTTGLDSNLVVTLDDSMTQAVATCATNCAVAAGDRLVIRFNRTGPAESRFRAIALEVSGSGQIVNSRGQTWSSGQQYVNRQLSFQLTSGVSTYRVDRAARFQNLHVELIDQNTGAVATATTAFDVTVCVGTGNPPSCVGTPTCTLNVGDSTRSDLTSVDVNQGDYFVVRGTNPGTTGLNLAYAFEIAEPPPPPTATQTATETATATATETATATDTPTNVPADTPTATPSGVPTTTPTTTASATPTNSSTPTISPTPTAVSLAGCAATPVPGCQTPGGSLVYIKDQSKLTWTWLKGTASASDFGDPVHGASNYRLCLYDEVGGVQSLKMGASAPGAGTCAGKPCWKQLGSLTPEGFKYKDRDLTPDGIAGIILKAGAVGKAKIIVKGMGSHLPPATPLDQDTNVTMQLVRSDGGVCWQAVYPAPASKNGNGQFKEKIR
jgi:hypothetical protein